MKDQLFFEIKRNSGFELQAESFDTTLGFGFVLDEVSIENPNLNLPQIQIERIKLSPSLLSLIRFRPKVGFQVELPQGTLQGTFEKQGGMTQGIKLNLNEIKIGGKSLEAATNLDLGGMLAGQVTISGNLKTFENLNGNADIELRKFKLGKLSVLNMNIPELNLSQISLVGKIANNKLVVEKFNVGGSNEDLYAMAGGDVVLNPRDIRQSRLNLKLKFKMSKKLSDEFSLFLPFIAAALGSDGFYMIKIDGRLDAPRALPERS
jgi:type II secretion system protein N